MKKFNMMTIWVSIGMYLVYLLFQGLGFLNAPKTKAKEHVPAEVQDELQVVDEVKEFYEDYPGDETEQNEPTKIR